MKLSLIKYLKEFNNKEDCTIWLPETFIQGNEFALQLYADGHRTEIHKTGILIHDIAF